MLKKGLFSLIIALLFLAIPLDSAAQAPTEDVVYMKNGTILRGKLLEYSPAGDVKVEILGGTVLVYPAADVDKITKEPAKSGSVLQQPLTNGYNSYVRPPKKPFVYKTKGIGNITDVGLMIGSEAGVAIHTIGQYVFNPRLQLGAGIGIDRLTWGLKLAPIYIDFRGEVLKESPITPMYIAQAGWTLPMESNDGDWITNVKGGPMAAFGFGLKFNTRYGLRYHLSLTYKMEKASFDQQNWGGWPQTVNGTFYRVCFNTGISF